jgi:SAM-dependent methyltransferase
MSLLGIPLSAADAHVFEQFVVPRYLAFFGALAVDMMIPGAPPVVANVGCRTGYPDGIIAERAPGATLMGVDRSPAALDVARAKASLLSNIQASYQVSEGFPTALPAEQFTHAMSIHPLCTADQRKHLLSELRRLLVPGGQALVALPLRGSFPEINDMIREYALRADAPDLGKAIDTAAASRPTIETISEELENAGLTDVDVDVQLIAVSFASGKEFLEDPIASLMVLPDTRAVIGPEPPNVDSSLKYVHEAISKYWSEGVFELTVNVGCASGRRLA